MLHNLRDRRGMGTLIYLQFLEMKSNHIVIGLKFYTQGRRGAPAQGLCRALLLPVSGLPDLSMEFKECEAMASVLPN